MQLIGIVHLTLEEGQPFDVKGVIASVKEFTSKWECRDCGAGPIFPFDGKCMCGKNLWITRSK